MGRGRAPKPHSIKGLGARAHHKAVLPRQSLCCAGAADYEQWAMGERREAGGRSCVVGNFRIRSALASLLFSSHFSRAQHECQIARSQRRSLSFHSACSLRRRRGANQQLLAPARPVKRANLRMAKAANRQASRDQSKQTASIVKKRRAQGDFRRAARSLLLLGVSWRVYGPHLAIFVAQSRERACE